MTLPASGPISFSQINVELGRPANATLSLSDPSIRTLTGIASGPVNLHSSRGKSFIVRTKGFFAGGATNTNATVSYTTIDKVPFSTEVIAPISATTNGTKRALGSRASSATVGYLIAGVVNSIEGLTFATEAAVAKAAVLSTMRSKQTSVQSTLKGYSVSGGVTVSAAPLTVIDALVFATETCGAIAAGTPTPRRYGTGINSSTVGYSAGGLSISSPGFNSIEGLTFATEVTVAKAQVLTNAKYSAAGHSFANRGYYVGGSSSSSVGFADTDTLNFSTETVTAITAALSSSRGYLGCVDSTLVGIASGGGIGGTLINVTDKITDATQTMTTLASALSVSRELASGLQV